VFPISSNKNEIKKITSEIQDIIERKAILREKSVKIIEESI